MPLESRDKQVQARAALIGAACLFVAEYLSISFRYDARPLIHQAGALRLLGTFGKIAPSVIVVVAFLFVFFGGRLRSGWEGAVLRSSRQHVAWSWVGLHAAAYAALLHFTGRVFGGAQPSGAWVIGAWFLSLVALLASLALALLPWRIWGELVRDLAPVLLTGIVVGVAGWAAGIVSMELWDPLGVVTLYGVAVLLQWAVPDLVFDPAHSEVGSQRFYVSVDSVCSGYEGIGLILAFLGTYFWMARRELRFPRAWLLVPLAVVAVFGGNILRIFGLILVGLNISPVVALGGFHSKAGWVFFCAVGLAIVAWSRRSPWLSRAPVEASIDNPVSPYMVPLLSVIAGALLSGLFANGLDRAYGLRVAAGALALFVYRGRIKVPDWKPSLEAAGIGALVFVMWLALAGTPDETGTAVWRASLGHLEPLERSAWIFMKLIGSIVLIPVVEERAFRGYLLRRLIDADFLAVAWTRLSWLSVVVSSLAFGALHEEWLAGAVAGVLFAIIQTRRGNLGEAVFAHAVSNALIAIWALGLGRWDLWM